MRRGILIRTVVCIAAVAVLGGAVLAQRTAPDADANADADPPYAQEVLAPLLAAWIVQSRDAALARGAAAMPAEIREAFEGYIDAAILDRVRWRIDGQTGITGRVIFQDGAVRAVTLDNVILFANAAEAANVRLWAHELYHVMQFHEWGIDSFASRFVSDRRSIEHGAREFRWSWMKATGRVPDVEAAATERG